MAGNEIVKTERVVVFTDIHDFSIAVQVLGERQYKFLQALYERLGDIVVEGQGELIKYLGDGLLCVFPAELAQAAVASAVAMREAFKEMVQQWGLPVETELEVGIDMGEVGEGVFGHSSLQHREVFGNVVNRAAKIGHHRGVAITEQVYAQVRDEYMVRELPEVVLKWQTEPLKIWEVVS